MKIFALVHFVLILCTTSTEAFFRDIVDVVDLIVDVADNALKAWEIFDSSTLSDQHPFLEFKADKQQEALNRLGIVGDQITEIKLRHSENIVMAIQSVGNLFAYDTVTSHKMNIIRDACDHITLMFEQMQSFKKHQNNLESSTLLAFAEWAISPNADAINPLLQRLHHQLFGTLDGQSFSMQQQNFLETLRQNYEISNDQICHTQQSSQQFIYSLYADIALAEIKGFAMMEFSWVILRIYGRGNYTQEAELARNNFKKRTEHTIKELNQVMHCADRIIWRCDPDKFDKGESYEEVTRLLQGFIENETDMDRSGSCIHKCDYYQSTHSKGCYDTRYCDDQPQCTGKLYNCVFIDNKLFVCPAPKESLRRYEFITYGEHNDRVLGQNGSCASHIKKAETWRRGLVHCSYCFCLCDENSIKSDRYFSLKDQLSDVMNNKVVTGLRFIKKERVFHLQIQEGELMPRGIINKTTLLWKPISNPLENTYTLAYDSRSIDLDEIYTDSNISVVTGLRLTTVHGRLRLEARFTKFNFETGDLIEPEKNNYWTSNYYYGEKKEKINLNDPDVSTRSQIKSKPNLKQNQYIDFVNTSMDKDAAQSTVPFIDIQDVISNPPVPLSGIGIYHKGQIGFGGFIAPKIITYDFTPYVRLPTPQQ